MKKNKHSVIKYITIVFFFGFLFTFSTLTLATPDKKINEIENKILTQLPRISIDKLISGSFMKNFDSYSSDQFPMRTEFIKLKNSYSYAMGIREFRNIYVGNSSRLMEKFIFNEEIMDDNISQVIQFSSYLHDKYNILSTIMIIPTSIAFYEEDLPKYAVSDSQEDALKYLEYEFNGNESTNDYLNFYTPYEVLKANKDEYIYFNTDHHWTQLGAKIAFEDYYGDVLDDCTKVANDFYGTYYSKALLPQIKGDTIYSFDNYNNFKINIDFDKNYNTLYDKNKLSGKNKYQYFLHGDPAIAVIEGNSDSSSELLIFKDSYAHNFIPFLASKYSKIHVVDPRYYKINIDEYMDSNKNIKEVLFLNNISTFNSSLLFK